MQTIYKVLKENNYFFGEDPESLDLIFLNSKEQAELAVKHLTDYVAKLKIIANKRREFCLQLNIDRQNDRGPKFNDNGYNEKLNQLIVKIAERFMDQKPIQELQEEALKIKAEHESYKDEYEKQHAKFLSARSRKEIDNQKAIEEFDKQNKPSFPELEDKEFQKLLESILPSLDADDSIFMDEIEVF